MSVPAALVVVDKPTALDHELAALRGIYLCEECGEELRYPANPQLCGFCEERRFDEENPNEE